MGFTGRGGDRWGSDSTGSNGTQVRMWILLFRVFGVENMIRFRYQTGLGDIWEFLSDRK